MLNGKRLDPPEKMRYILLNKPCGVITASEDDRGRKTVLDIVRVRERVFPVGRLDLDTEGVLLLTNDGELTYRLTHPRFEIEKVYRVFVKGRMKQDSINKLHRGVDIGENTTVNCEAKIIRNLKNSTILELKIHQGKKRQVKRMMEAVGHRVTRLERIKFAGLTIDGIGRGEWRELTEDEIRLLYNMTGLNREGAGVKARE